MKIGIISDTHDHIDNIQKAVELFNLEQCEVVLHAGDFVAPFALKAMHKINGKIIAVLGNNDGEKEGLLDSIRDGDLLNTGTFEFELDNKKFLLTHDPAHLPDKASWGKFDYVVYGHLHEKEYISGKPIVINPGECCGWVSGSASVVILDTKLNTVEFKEL